MSGTNDLPQRVDGPAGARSKHLGSWFLLGLLGFIWGTNFLFMKIALGVVPALEVAWLRTIFGALPIAALALVRVMTGIFYANRDEPRRAAAGRNRSIGD